jgi:hypothetical protein
MSLTISRAELGSTLILLAASLNLLAADKTPKENPADTKARQEVKAALQAEAAGDNAHRAELLANAQSSAPELAEANWHLAKLRIGGKWLSLIVAEQQAVSDPQLTEYRKLRSESEGNPKLLRALARWCLKNSWDDTARLHYAQLLNRTDLDQETTSEAIKRMDLHYVGDNWITGEEVKAQEEKARAIDTALRQWRPRLKRLQVIVDTAEYPARERAIKDLQAINDPQAIIALESFQLDGGDRFCEEVAKLLAKFPQFEATEALVHFAVLSSFSAAREAAINGLKHRPKHDYVPLLLSGLVAPIKTQFSISVDSRGIIQYTHAFAREDSSTRAVDVRNLVATPVLWQPKRQVFTSGQPSLNRWDMILSAVNNIQLVAQNADLQTTVVNQQVEAANRRVFDALERLTEAQVARDANQWFNWWQDHNQYYWPKQTYYAYQRRPISYVSGYGRSCFLAGTLVRTETGLSPIESLRPGDRILAQDQDSGELAYKVVLRTTIRPPAKMTRITTGSDEITTTLGHPFWVDGHGWKMAKELTAGDLLHSLGGAERIDKVEPAGEDKAYNLVVDDFNTYFVGQAGLLVHDNEFRKPTRATVPGLVEEPVAQAKR